MCTVSVLLEAERNMPSMLKAREQMLTHLRGERRPGLHGRPEAPGAASNLPGGLLTNAAERRSSLTAALGSAATVSSLSSHFLKKHLEKNVRMAVSSKSDSSLDS